MIATVTSSGSGSGSREFDVRRAETRGHMDIGWLDARFSFSFGPYRNPKRNRFSVLQALNEDLIQPGTGFEMHPHQDLEIFILPLSGQVEHRDSLGNAAVVRPGDVQKMTAGKGIWHSQMNASHSEIDHHLQIWLLPRTKGREPGIEQKRFERQGRQGRWQLLVSEQGSEGSLSVDQDAKIMRVELARGQSVRYQPLPGRSIYLHVIHGNVTGSSSSDFPWKGAVRTGDAVAMPRGGDLELLATSQNAEALLFDLPSSEGGGV